MLRITSFILLVLLSIACAGQFIEVGSTRGDLDGDGIPDNAVLLQSGRTWQVEVALAKGIKVLVDQISAPDLNMPMEIGINSYPELGALPVITLGPTGNSPVWYYQWNGRDFMDVSTQIRASGGH